MHMIVGELAKVMYSSAQRKSELDKPNFTRHEPHVPHGGIVSMSCMV